MQALDGEVEDYASPIVSTATPPVSGALALSPDGSLVYTPTLDFSGVVTFTYHANDGYLNSNVATVTLVVEPEELFIYLPVVNRNVTAARHPDLAGLYEIWHTGAGFQP